MSKTIEERQAEMRARQLASRKPSERVVAIAAKHPDIPVALAELPVEPKLIVVRPWPRLLTIELAADYAGVSRSTINEWMAEGKLRPYPLPGIRGRQSLDKIVFERSVLDRFLGLRPE